MSEPFHPLPTPTIAPLTMQPSISDALPALPALPPPLPTLSQQYSDGHEYQSQSSIRMSKLDLVKTALTESVIPAAMTLPHVSLRIVSFDSNARMVPGTIEDVSRLRPQGGTNFTNMFKCLDENPVPVGTRTTTIILTDGHDSTRSDRDVLMGMKRICDLFDGVIAIGNDIDKPFLEHLSFKSPETYVHTSNPVILQNAIKAFCFGGAKAIASNVTIVFWLENNGVFLPTDPSISYKHVEMIDANDAPSSDLFVCNHDTENGVFVLAVNEQPLREEMPVVVTLCVDQSGSMREFVREDPTPPIYTSTRDEKGGYLKITVNARMIDDVYKLIGKGIVRQIDVTYTDRDRVKRVETVQCVKVYSEQTFVAGFQMLSIMRGLESSCNISELYLSKLKYSNLLQEPSVPDFMKSLYSFVWERLRNAYMAQRDPYVVFRDGDSAASPCMTQLVHTLSAGASDSTAGVARRCQQDPITTECRICFTEEATVLCLPCKHIGACETCFQQIFEDRKKSDPTASCPCPFCVTSVEEVRIISSMKCPWCISPATRVGVCKHPLACENDRCRWTEDGSPDTLYCETCKVQVGSFRVYHQ